MGVRQERRENLKLRLIEAASARVQAHGLGGVRARDITADAGCALGALYKVFADLNELMLRVNARTLAALDATLTETTRNAADAPAALKALAIGYLSFARENRNLWTALFEHRMPEGASLPAWHVGQLTILIEHIIEPLATLQPSLDAHRLTVRARTLFSAVHGIVSISLEDRFVGLAPAEIESELENFVDTFVEGIERRQ